MATAALRAVLVIAALILGVFVLSKAFPTGGEASTPVAPDQTGTTPSPTPSPTEEQTGGGGGAGGGGQQETHEPADIRVQVLNDTDVSGLAGDTASLLEGEGYRVVTIGNYDGDVDRTTIFFRPDFRADAQILRDAQFPTAGLEQATPDLQGVDLTVVVDQDYVEGEEEA